MIKVETLKRLLDVKKDELKGLELEQLRIMLGIFRYLVRTLEREINERSASFPIGNVPNK